MCRFGELDSIRVHLRENASRCPGDALAAQRQGITLRLASEQAGRRRTAAGRTYRLLKNCFVHGTSRIRTEHKSDSKRVSSGLFHQPANPVALYAVAAAADQLYEDALPDLMGSQPEMRNWRPTHEEMPALAAPSRISSLLRSPPSLISSNTERGSSIQVFHYAA
jgi:hypothetical protein